ncbi:hypothetical protein [Okeania sp. SIO1I7]|uniref:hypothetical protein n=1 Tax=Okeania sp. SIO1I7 TaxID=2607772 RepID=UPI0013FC6F21|nr:hypothetical protein [Okeania sp. SIO1I7]NET26398.1 hypothetical protein [Okeania sp. SIO1I7]
MCRTRAIAKLPSIIILTKSTVISKDEVDKNPQLKERIIRGVKAGSFAALKKTIDHPVAQFFIEGVKEVLKKH